MHWRYTVRSRQRRRRGRERKWRIIEASSPKHLHNKTPVRQMDWTRQWPQAVIYRIRLVSLINLKEKKQIRKQMRWMKRIEKVFQVTAQMRTLFHTWTLVKSNMMLEMPIMRRWHPFNHFIRSRNSQINPIQWMISRWLTLLRSLCRLSSVLTTPPVQRLSSSIHLRSMKSLLRVRKMWRWPHWIWNNWNVILNQFFLIMRISQHLNWLRSCRSLRTRVRNMQCSWSIVKHQKVKMIRNGCPVRSKGRLNW